MNYIQHGTSAPAPARPQCCNHCKVPLGNGVRIVKEFKQVRHTYNMSVFDTERNKDG